MPRPFPKRVLAAVENSAVLRIRAGEDHRFLGIWGVVARGRIFVRPWNDKPTGWRQAFLADPGHHGAIRLAKDGPDIPVRARPVRGERLNDAVDAAYSAKYASKANASWVRGLVTARRRKTTMEMLPG